MKHRFLQYLPCENLDLEVPSVEISNQTSINDDLETSPKKKKRTFKVFELNKLIYKGPKITPQIGKNHVNAHLESILLLPPSSRVVLRCQSGPPDCSRGMKMVPRSAKIKPPYPTNGNPAEPKGSRRQRAYPLR